MIDDQQSHAAAHLVDMDAFPASKVQEQLFFAQQALGDAPTYHVPLFPRGSADLDVETLRRAVERVVARHEALRTRFLASREGLRQVVDDDITWNRGRCFAPVCSPAAIPSRS
ncbi:condensation domain-containing protein [Herbihabitans rhizosphaerae]|uniref:Condensation domain-containing protein n=1 Tax=Herbihabitans rhizosphaerae TaxID=1872711 RepID=A0A4Q7KCI1_9PSEU|nr:condensation domain-containing protein [Herbihabitans rhizosphaerae]RZS31198.1 condensation domain-containing protein [Herbihabitans rhizosphaerae]